MLPNLIEALKRIRRRKAVSDWDYWSPLIVHASYESERCPDCGRPLQLDENSRCRECIQETTCTTCRLEEAR